MLGLQDLFDKGLSLPPSHSGLMNSQFATTLARALPSASRAGLSTASPLRLARPFSSSSVWKAPDNPKQKTRRAEYQIFNATGSEGASPAAHLNKLMGEGKNDTPLSNPLSYGSMASSLESELLPHPYSDRQPPHHLHVYSHKHNTILTLTRPNGDPLLVRSCGHLGFRKSQRSGYDPAYQLAVHMFGQMQEKGLILDIQRLELVFRDFGPGREAFTKVLLGNEGRNIRGLVSRVTDATRIKFGGTRSRKVRRLG